MSKRIPASSNVCWAVLMQSDSLLDGKVSYLMGEPNGTTRTALFPTRSKARQYIDERHGYIKTRKDLRSEPFGWKVPKAVRVSVAIRLEAK